LRDSGIQGLRSKITSKELIAKIDGYELGVQHGKTMAEVDAYYEGLLQEIKELEKLLKEDHDGQKTGQEDNQGV